MQRRDLLRHAAVLGAVSWGRVGTSAWAASTSQASANGAPPRLIVVFLRGAVDGLSVVVPHADADYYRLRSTIALPRPGQTGGALDLDGHFGLHPALQALWPLWQDGRLAFVHASGSPDPTRSHFDAQDYMESGTPGRKSTPDGWMNRALGILPAWAGAPAGLTGAPARAVCLGPTPPRIYAGPNPVAYLPQGPHADRPTLMDRPRIAQAFSGLYAGNDKMGQAFREGQAAHEEVRDAMSMSPADLQAEMTRANNGAPLPAGFAQDATRLGTLMRKDARVQLAFAALGGWDTHANQGAAQGQLANHLSALGEGLAALARGLGPVFEHTVIVTLSEFGRTAAQNGNGGTDHGHGNVMWLAGGPVRGGRVHGRWPGLDAAGLHEGRDLAVTTDFRWVLAQVLARHLRVRDTALETVFPQMPGPDAGLDVIRG